METVCYGKDDIMDAKAVCVWLGISERSLQRLRAKGEMPYARMGRRVFFSRTEIIGALRRCNKKGGAQ